MKQPRATAAAHPACPLRRQHPRRLANGRVQIAGLITVTYMVRQRGIDVVVAGGRVSCQQRRHRHDLAGSATAARRHAMARPGLRQFASRGGSHQALEGRDRPALHLFQRRLRRNAPACPSKCTVHTPHMPIRQPVGVAASPAGPPSRMACSKGLSGAQSTLTVRPLTTSAIISAGSVGRVGPRLASVPRSGKRDCRRRSMPRKTPPVIIAGRRFAESPQAAAAISVLVAYAVAPVARRQAGRCDLAQDAMHRGGGMVVVSKQRHLAAHGSTAIVLGIGEVRDTACRPRSRRTRARRAAAHRGSPRRTGGRCRS